jgi:lysozyme
VFVDPTNPADRSADPAAEVEPAARPARPRLRSRRTLWRAGAALLALAAYGAGAQLATNEVVVKPGDTLTKIAGTYRTSVKELVVYNDISDPNLIVVGQTIAIPPGTGELRHDVRRGETLTSIASTYGTTVGAIAKRNNLTDADQIRAGQTLVVPRSTATTAPVAPATTAPTPAAPATTVRPTTAPTTVATTVAAPSGAASSASLGTPTAPVTAPPTTAPPVTAPPTTATPTTAPSTTIPRVTVPSGGTVSTMWVVQSGDTIASIAARFGLAPRRLASVNALSESDELVPGQRIYVPQS